MPPERTRDRADGRHAASSRASRSPSGIPTPDTVPDPSRAALPSRRTHVKSKKGCRTCKRRKVKCDEQRPSCGNCIKHGAECEFAQEQQNQTPQPQPHQQFHPYQAQQQSIPPTPDGAEVGAAGELNMVDLRLLHNFTTYTCATMAPDPRMRQMFQTTCVRMAFDCEFLMRATLAVSAIHLARFHRERSDYYAAVGLAHYQAACRQAMPFMDRLDHLELRQYEELHMFTVLTMFIALGSPKEHQDTLVMGDAMAPSWLTMARSSEPILTGLNPAAYRGILSPMFDFGRERWRVLYGDSTGADSPIMADLQAAVNAKCDEPDLLPIYNEMIDKLRLILARLVPPATAATASSGSTSSVAASPAVADAGGSGGFEGGSGGASSTSSPNDVLLQGGSKDSLRPWDLFVWQFDSTRRFFPLLRRAPPMQEALAIYAHFLILLKKLENTWWLEGWAAHIMDMVWRGLDDEHRHWVEWPIQELGWVPP